VKYDLPTDAVLLIFCKAPIPGQVKTRLIPELSPQQAAEVHKVLTLRTLNLADNDLCAVQLWCSPGVDHAFFSAVENIYPLTLHTQQGNNLGEKMLYAFTRALEKYQNAVLIGCDCPSLTRHDLKLAFEALSSRQNDVVIAPAEDGGYVLVGMDKPRPELFREIPWGGLDVMPVTRQRMITAKLSSHELREQWDVDTAADLQRFNACC